MKRYSWSLLITAIILAFSSLCAAQDAGEPEKHFTGNLGAGFSMTGGNTDTASFNISGELTYDPKTKNIMKFNGLYLRSSSNNEDTADRLSLAFRDEYQFSKRVFAYGAMGYLRDPFKDINYLLNPQGGIGFKPILKKRIELTLLAGSGSVWEKNPDVDVQTSGTLNAGENFLLKFTDSARLTQDFSALWKAENFSDALYHFDIALVTSITSRAEVKLEFIDDFKNVTPDPTIKKNDTAFIFSFLYKI
jgi:putative salt-induced outer membrane protein YdiY